MPPFNQQDYLTQVYFKKKPTKIRKEPMQYINKNLNAYHELLHILIYLKNKKIENCGKCFLFHQIQSFHYQDVQVFEFFFFVQSFNLMSLGALVPPKFQLSSEKYK